MFFIRPNLSWLFPSIVNVKFFNKWQARCKIRLYQICQYFLIMIGRHSTNFWPPFGSLKIGRIVLFRLVLVPSFFSLFLVPSFFSLILGVKHLGCNYPSFFSLILGVKRLGCNYPSFFLWFLVPSFFFLWFLVINI